MSFEIILLILLAALLHASWNAVIKGGSNKLYETGLNCFGGGVGVLFIVPFLPFPALESLKFLAGSCTVHIAYYLCIAVAYRNVDMSFAYTIMRGTAPLLTSVFMLLSGHEMPLAGWLGILCLCAGVLTLTRDNIKNGKFNINGALAAVGTAVVIMGYTLFDGYGARASRESHQLRMLALRHQHVPHQRHPAAETAQNLHPLFLQPLETRPVRRPVQPRLLRRSPLGHDQGPHSDGRGPA